MDRTHPSNAPTVMVQVAGKPAIPATQVVWSASAVSPPPLVPPSQLTSSTFPYPPTNAAVQSQREARSVWVVLTRSLEVSTTGFATSFVAPVAPPIEAAGLPGSLDDDEQPGVTTNPSIKIEPKAGRLCRIVQEVIRLWPLGQQLTRHGQWRSVSCRWQHSASISTRDARRW